MIPSGLNDPSVGAFCCSGQWEMGQPWLCKGILQWFAIKNTMNDTINYLSWGIVLPVLAFDKTGKNDHPSQGVQLSHFDWWKIFHDLKKRNQLTAIVLCSGQVAETKQFGGDSIPCVRIHLNSGHCDPQYSGGSLHCTSHLLLQRKSLLGRSALDL